MNPSDPLCFVLMPLDRNADAAGRLINFDAVYRDLIAPSVRAAGLEPIRANEEMTGDAIRTALVEQLILCDYAVVDLTCADANVFYELGRRHALRPDATVLMFATGTRVSLDVAQEQALPYLVSESGDPADLEIAKHRLTDRLITARDLSVRSPVVHLIEGSFDISRLKTDLFRDRNQYSTMWKERLAHARETGLDAVRAAEADLGDISEVEAGVLVDLLLSYRAVRGYDEMVALVQKIPRPLARTPLVREQLGLALNRLGRRIDAEQVLHDLIEERGASSETYGILGRVHKDQWNDARQAGEEHLARTLLDKAINAYVAGFEADWRDAYPGINAVTLMEIREPPDRRRTQLIPVVSYAVDRRLASGVADYWDHAARLELAVLAEDETAAVTGLTQALAMVRERWEPEATAMNLRLIRDARERRGHRVPWAEHLERELLRRAGR